MTEWRQVADVRAFLATKGTRRVREHHWYALKRMPWPACKHCGLIRLRNQVSRLAAAAKCVTMEDG